MEFSKFSLLLSRVREESPCCLWRSVTGTRYCTSVPTAARGQYVALWTEGDISIFIRGLALQNSTVDRGVLNSTALEVDSRGGSLASRRRRGRGGCSVGPRGQSQSPIPDLRTWAQAFATTSAVNLDERGVGVRNCAKTLASFSLFVCD